MVVAEASMPPSGGLQRVALSAQNAYWWINGIGLVLTGVLARMSWSAYGEHEFDKALLCIVCQFLAIALAILGRRALSANMRWAGLGALACAGGCAWWASHGLTAAWAASGERPNEFMTFFLPALEPTIFLLAEHIKEGRDAIRKAHEEARIAAEVKQIRERDLTSAQNVTRLPANRRRASGGAVALAAAAALGAPHPAAAEAPQVQTDAPQTHVADAGATQRGAPRKAPTKRVTKQEETHQAVHLEAKARASLLLREAPHRRLSNREIARQTGLSPSTVDRLAKGMTPLADVA